MMIEKAPDHFPNEVARVRAEARGRGVRVEICPRFEIGFRAGYHVALRREHEVAGRQSWSGWSDFVPADGPGVEFEERLRKRVEFGEERLARIVRELEG